MTMLAAALTSAWVLFCLVFFAIGVPMAAPGSFKSNEDPAHEATESAAREAQEDAGQRPTVK